MDSDFLKWTWRTFIWARGFVAAVSLVAILDSAFGWERAEFLKLTHALVTHWDQLLRGLVSPLLTMLDLPRPSRDLLSMTVLMLVTLPIFLISGVRDARKARIDGHRATYWTNIVFLISMSLLLAAMLLYWVLTPDLKLDPLSRWILPVTFFPLIIVMGMSSVSGKVEHRMARAILAGVVFIITLELLYMVPYLQVMAADFVQSAEQFDDRH